MLLGRAAPLLAFSLLLVACTSFSATSPAPATPLTRLSASPGGPIALGFVANRGQLDDSVAFYLPGDDGATYFTASGLTIAVAPRLAAGTRPPDYRRWALKLDFLGASPARPDGVGPAGAQVSYMRGGPDDWRAAPSYASLRYAELWPGVDLVYLQATPRLKYAFVVKPGADPAAIRLAYRGASSLRLAPDGALVIDTPARQLRDEAPLSFQVIDGAQRPVESRYTLDDDGSSYGFAVGAYDPRLPLIIDPATTVYAGYIGGGGGDTAYGVAVDRQGAAYVVGATSSAATSFPDQAGPDRSLGGPLDAFIAKVRPDGSGLVYAGYIGGDASEIAYDVAVDDTGAAYVIGQTFSTQASFPVIGGPDLIANGDSDAFIAKVRPDGSGLVYAGYIGGDEFDRATGVAVDALGRAHVVGGTSSASGFPLIVGPDITRQGYTNAFVARVSASGAALEYSGYIGSNGNTAAADVALDAAGAAYVVGDTNSADGFPVTPGPRPDFNPGSDAFIAKVRPDGSELIYAGFIGGDGFEETAAVAVDTLGRAYIVGSTTPSFPILIGPDAGGGLDKEAFVARVSADGARFDYAGLIGGEASDEAKGVAIDPLGRVVVAGYTFSPDFPVVGGPAGGDQPDAFLAQLSDDGRRLIFAGRYGGAGTELGLGAAADPYGGIYLVGATDSAETSFPAIGGPDLGYNGENDAFIIKINTLSRVFMPALSQ